jgi:hypothetical protein
MPQTISLRSMFRTATRLAVTMMLTTVTVACGDSANPAAPTEQTSAKPALQNAPELIETLNDVSERVLTGLPDGALQTELQVAFDRLVVALRAAAIDGAKIPAAKTALTSARTILERANLVLGVDPGFAADLDAADMALTLVAGALSN